VSETNLVLLINQSRFPKRLGNRVGTNFYYLTKMNNLDVKKFGVQELNAKEMNEIEGGALIRINGLFTWLYEAIKSIF